MSEVTKQRFIGAAVLIALLAIFIPFFFSGDDPDQGVQKDFSMPPVPTKPVVEDKTVEVFQPRSLAKVNLDKVKTLIKDSKPVAVPVAKAWVVQLASFAERANGQALVKKLKAAGFAAYARTAKNAQGVKVTRVLVGPETNRQKAQTLMTKLEAKMKIKGFIVAYEPLEVDNG